MQWRQFGSGKGQPPCRGLNNRSPIGLHSSWQSARRNDLVDQTLLGGQPFEEKSRRGFAFRLMAARCDVPKLLFRLAGLRIHRPRHLRATKVLDTYERQNY